MCLKSPQGRKLKLCPEVTLGDGVDFCSGISVREPSMSVGRGGQVSALGGGSLQRPRGCHPSMPVFAELDLGQSCGRMRADGQLCGR